MTIDDTWRQHEMCRKRQDAKQLENDELRGVISQLEAMQIQMANNAIKANDQIHWLEQRIRALVNDQASTAVAFAALKAKAEDLAERLGEFLGSGHPVLERHGIKWQPDTGLWVMQ